MRIPRNDFEGTLKPVPDADEVTPGDHDNCVGAQVNLPHPGSLMDLQMKMTADWKPRIG